MHDEIYILIDQYLSGELSPVEQHNFEERLGREPELAAKFELYKSVSEELAIKFKTQGEEASLREKLKTLGNRYVISKQSTKVRTLQWYYWAAAASVVIICGVFLFQQNSSLPRYDEYASYEPMALVERGDTDTLTQLAEEHFNAKNYEKALYYLEILTRKDEGQYELQLYRGIALLELNRLTEAEKTFNHIREFPSAYQNTATWYLALLALKRQAYDQCEALLRELPPESEMYNESRKLLKRLE